MTQPTRKPVAVVTAGAKRLGAAMVAALAQAGYDIIVHYRTGQAEALSTARQATALGARAFSVHGDLALRSDVEQLLQRSLDHFGHVDLLIANAGAFRRTPIATLSDDDWSDMIDNNLRLTWLCAQAFGVHMRQHTGGAIISMADVAALRPWAEYLPYNIAKAGIVTLTQTLAKELAPKVRVNAIAPGPVLFPDDYPDDLRQREIDRTLLKRAGSPDHIVQAALFLARNDYVTGVTLPVDGGRLLT